MRKEFNRHIILNAALGCGVPTGVINGVLAYFTGHERTFMEAAIDITGTIAAVALIVSLIIIPLMRKLAHTIPDPGITRDEVKLLRNLPTNTFTLSLTLTVLSAVFFGVIPAVIIYFFKPSTIGVMDYAIFKGIYSGIAAIPVNYIATAMAKLTAGEAKA